jgi:hypothetical protein
MSAPPSPPTLVLPPASDEVPAPLGFVPIALAPLEPSRSDTPAYPSQPSDQALLWEYASAVNAGLTANEVPRTTELQGFKYQEFDRLHTRFHLYWKWEKTLRRVCKANWNGKALGDDHCAAHLTQCRLLRNQLKAKAALQALKECDTEARCLDVELGQMVEKVETEYPSDSDDSEYEPDE